MITIPVLPESAPFNPTQRAWLNGFFAGILSLPAISGGDIPAPVTAPPAVEEDFPWHDPALPLEERLALAEGRPAGQVLMAAMAQLDCGSCGYLCQTYAEAISGGEEKDLAKCVPGGKETARKLKELVARPASGPALPVILPQPGPNGVHSNGTRLNGVHSHGAPTAPARPQPVPARVLEVKRLNGEGSDKDVRHVAFDLRGSGLRYEVGDALGVHAENCGELADAILRALAASGDEPVVLADGRRLLAREALLRECDLTRRVEPALAVMAGWSRGPAEAARLRALAEDDAEGFLDGLDLLDLLERFPAARGPVEELAAALAPLQPRLYSIASSLKAHAEQVHLTVGMVRYRREGCPRPRKGVASTFLGERACAGAAVRLFIQPSHGFRLPVDPAAPVIMVGPGTGIAPFRAFLQERQATGARGKNWLFFGDQRRATDYLYREELEAHQSAGLLSRLDLAFSRDQAEKVYVQHRMQENAAELWRWLETGAHFYVCGDAQRMARDVDRALHQVIAEQSGRGEAAAKAYVADLKRAKRYQRDVY